jgi:hypothetical protein
MTGGLALQVLDVAHGVRALVLGQVFSERTPTTRRLPGMFTQQLTVLGDLYQAAVGARLDVLADASAGDRVERLGDLDVVVTGHFGVGIDRRVVARDGRGKQIRLLHLQEVLERLALGGAMHACPGLLQAPDPHSAAGRQQVGKILAREARVAAVRHRSFDTRLLSRRADDAGVDSEATCLGVLQEGGVDAGAERVGPVNDGLQVVHVLCPAELCGRARGSEFAHSPGRVKSAT